jgi:hypothetical protein
VFSFPVVVRGVNHSLYFHCQKKNSVSIGLSWAQEVRQHGSLAILWCQGMREVLWWLAIVIGLFPKNFFAAVGRANCSWGVVNFCLLQNLEDLNPRGKVTQGSQQECMQYPCTFGKTALVFILISCWRLEFHSIESRR